MVDISAQFGQRITGIHLVNNTWEVEQESGDRSAFDCVILTMPVAQVLQLSGCVPDLIGKSNIPIS